MNPNITHQKSIKFSKKWPTRTSDLALARSIMKSHLQGPEKLLKILDDFGFSQNDEVLKVKFPPWIDALKNKLQAVHGEERYPEILHNVMVVILRNWFSDIISKGQAQILEGIITLAFKKTVH